MDIQLGEEMSKWRVEVVMQMEHFSLRLPFFGLAAFYKEHSDLPWKFERETWTAYQERTERRAQLLKSLFVKHIMRDMA